MSEPSSPPKRTIAVVDDDPAVRAALAFSFGLEGFEVLTFRSGEEVVADLRLPQGTCVVLDFRLPGMDGLSAAAALMARRRDIRALLTTTNPTRQTRSRAEALGVTIIEKPLMDDALHEAVFNLSHAGDGALRPAGH